MVAEDIPEFALNATIFGSFLKGKPILTGFH
jgi:hypothetical protein